MTSKTYARGAARLLLGAVLSLSAVASASAQNPDPSSPFFLSLRYSGSGCPQGTVGQSLSGDRQTFTLIFDNFVASKGPGVPITENRKNCLLVLSTHTPDGQMWVA